MIRSLLYVPASSERFLAKAHERGADAIILDLEDAVARLEKARARAALSEAVPAVRRNGATVVVRINAVATGLAVADDDAAWQGGGVGSRWCRCWTSPARCATRARSSPPAGARSRWSPAARTLRRRWGPS